ncbi:MAG: type II secretion system F family protein [Actinomycetales bacterium]|nr:type II secretion system F family protein [Actinomycetales bacterium]
MATMTASRSFAYKSRDAAGKFVKGKMEAPSEGAVAERLKGMGLSPVDIRESAAGTGLNREIDLGAFGGGVGLKDLAVMSRQMATMISSGLSLLKTLGILADQTQNKKLAKILGEVTHQVEVGHSLSDALAQHPTEFPPLMINMIRAGETGGFLEGAMDSIAVNFEKEHKLRSTIKSAMTYPVMVFILAMVAVVAMLLFIVPIFKNMYEGMGGELPLPTQMLVGISNSMVVVLPVLAVAGVAFFLWWRVNKHTERVRKVVDPLKLRLPIFGLLGKKIAIARFSRNLSDMIHSGVPILQALAIVGETSGNWVIENATRRVADSVRTGRSIAAPLAEETVFPPMVTQMIAVGEDSGALEIMLKKIAEFYDDEVQATTESLTSLIEPLMIAFLGVIVGGMIVALYLPIFNIINLVQQ